MLTKYNNLIWGISQRKDGSMKIKDKKKDRQAEENRQKFFSKLKINLNNIVSAGLVHGNKVAVVNKKEGGKYIRGADALITDIKNLFLTITVADCLPIYFYDPKKEIIGIAHAGWPGVVKNIAGRVVEVIAGNFQSKVGDILVYIGPHIQRCHFKVKDEVAKEFSKDDLIKKKGKFFIDLAKIVKRQLREEGVKHIKINSECTFCLSDKYFSFRRDKPKKIEVIIAYIGLKN